MDVLSIAGYHLSEQLYNGFRTVVYRGVQQADSLPVVIKLLKNPHPSFNELVQFRNQYTITKNLDYSGIIKAYTLEAYQNGYALVMEDFGGISLKDYFTHHERVGVLDEFLQVAIASPTSAPVFVLSPVRTKITKSRLIYTLVLIAQSLFSNIALKPMNNAHRSKSIQTIVICRK